MAHPFEFDRAIVREPGASVVEGLRTDRDAKPRFDAIRAEHAAYVAAMRAAGVAVDVLPPLDHYPDSIFVEDPALVFSEGAILLRPGAPSRLGETSELRTVLRDHFRMVLELDEHGYADGGDVLVTPSRVFVGLSARTDRAGAAALCEKLEQFGRQARIVQTPKAVLHLKSAVSLLDDETVLATAELAASGIFAGFRILTAPAAEVAAANALRVNAAVLVGKHYRRTIDLLAKENFNVIPLQVTEIGKLDAGLSCMSLRWRAASGS